MNINKLGESVFSASAKKDLSSSSAKMQKSAETIAKNVMKHSEEEIAELASNPKYAELFKSKKLAAPKNLNLEYFTSNIKKLAK